MAITTLNQLRAIFRRAGVRILYVKRLAPKQDNEKNQVLLASELSGLVNLFPSKLALRAPSASKKKRHSDAGMPIAEAHINYFWMNQDGNRFHAPDAKFIEYFQYPEVRFSGFLKGCKWAPDAIRRAKQARYGTRILCMGSNHAGEVIGLLLTALEDPLVANFPVLSSSGVSNVLGVLSTAGDSIEAPREILARELRHIVDGGWHASIRNAAGKVIPFKGNQGAGYTLEALLGVETNALKEPDIHGYEVKSFRGGKVSLMTPTADGGFEGDHDFRTFMDRYGRPAKKDDGSVRFGGLHRAGTPNSSTGFEIRVAGYEEQTDRFSSEPGDIRVELIDPAEDTVVSAWSLEKLATGWNAKHAAAVYVRASKRARPDSSGDEYGFLRPWYMCEGTDVWRLLRAIARGVVYYDPAHVVHADGRAKVRPQWRISTTRFGDVLAQLYATVAEVG